MKQQSFQLGSVLISQILTENKICSLVEWKVFLFGSANGRKLKLIIKACRKIIAIIIHAQASMFLFFLLSCT